MSNPLTFPTAFAWPPSPGPITQIQPFTYEDGITYVEILYALKKYILTEIVPVVNNLGDELNKAIIEMIAVIDAKLAEQNEHVEQEISDMITYVNNAIQQIIDNSIEVQDPLVAAMLANPDSETRKEGDTIYASKDTQTTVETGRLSNSSLDTRYGDTITVESYGAIGNGIADDAPAINSALSTGKPIRFTPGKTYRLGSVITGPNVQVDAHGANFIIDHGANAVQVNGDMTTPIAVNSWTASKEMTTESGAPTNIVTIEMFENVPASWKRDDIVVLASDDILPYSKDAATGNALQNRCGQFLRVLSSNGTQLKCIGTINDPQMTTSLRIAKMETVGKFSWSGGHFDYSDSAYDTGNGYLFWLARHVAPAIRDVEFRRIKSGGVYMRTCHSWLVDSAIMTGGVNSLGRGAYGYGVANFNGAYGILSNTRFSDLRHSYTNGGTFREAGLMSCDGYGRPHDNLIIGCVTESNSASAYDSHTQGRREMFRDCKAYNCSGFFLRGTYHTVVGCEVVNGATGFNINIESTGDRSYGHTIDGLVLSGVENVGIMTVNQKAGGVAFNAKEPVPNVIRNIRARSVTGRIFTGDNVRVVASDIIVENTAGASPIGMLFSNSDLQISNLSIIANNPSNTAVMSFAINGHPSPESNFEIVGCNVKGSADFTYFVSGTTTGSSFRGTNVFMEKLPTTSPKQSAYSMLGTSRPVDFS